MASGIITQGFVSAELANVLNDMLDRLNDLESAAGLQGGAASGLHAVGAPIAGTASRPLLPIQKDEDDSSLPVVIGFDAIDAVLPSDATIETIDDPVVILLDGVETSPLEVSEAEATAEDFETELGTVIEAGRGVKVSLSYGTAGCTYLVRLVVHGSTDSGSGSDFTRGLGFVVEVSN